MRFHLVDQILEWTPGRSLRGVKHLSLGEEYLRDHFPTFPVMPGVLMVQALVECGAWLWRLTDDAAPTVIVLRDARNIKYGSFMEPGKSLELTCDWVGTDGDRATFKGRGHCAGVQTIAAQITLVGYNLTERLPDGAERDAQLRAYWRGKCSWLQRGVVSAPSTKEEC